MADRLQRRRRRRKRVRWLELMELYRLQRSAHGRRRLDWMWTATWGSIAPPKHSIAIYDTPRPTDGP